MQYATVALQTISAIDKTTAIARQVIEATAGIFNEIVVDLSLSALESGVITRQWWERRGKEATCEALCMMTFFLLSIAFILAMAGCCVWWLVKNVDQFIGLDGELCPCLGKTPEPIVEDVQVHIYTAWAFGKFGRFQGELPEVSELVGWSQGLGV